jgi:ferredoxin
MPVVTFVKQDITIEVPKGANLRLLALEHGVDLYVFPSNLLNCRGRGLCGTCRVKVDDLRALSPRTLTDERKCGWEGKNYRLACQSQVLDNMRVETNPRRVLGWMNHSTYERMKGNR